MMAQSKDTSEEEKVLKQLERLKLDQETATKVSRKSSQEKVREKVWNLMDKLKLNKEFNNRNPENPKRIPFFKQCERAAYRALDLPEIKDACVIKVNPSMAQMKLRELLLKAKKTLLVPCTSLTDEKFLFQC